MQVGPSGYDAWRKRLSKAPNLRRKSLKQLSRDCYFENRRRYGARRIQKALKKIGTKIEHSQVRSLMKEEGLEAIQNNRFKPRTADSKETIAAPNLLIGVNLKECAADWLKRQIADLINNEQFLSGQVFEFPRQTIL